MSISYYIGQYAMCLNTTMTVVNLLPQNWPNMLSTCHTLRWKDNNLIAQCPEVNRGNEFKGQRSPSKDTPSPPPISSNLWSGSKSVPTNGNTVTPMRVRGDYTTACIDIPLSWLYSRYLRYCFQQHPFCCWGCTYGIDQSCTAHTEVHAAMVSLCLRRKIKTR